MALWRTISSNAGFLVPARVRRWVEKRFASPAKDPKATPKILTIDIVGACNLRCPSCPVGNTGPVNESGLMSTELFQRIIDKAAAEFDICGVLLFNWTESLLHPELPEFIRIVKRKNLGCMLSSNLNILRNIDEILNAGPDHFRISLSGFSQEIYGKTHLHGQIERVKENMRLLSAAKKRLKAHKTKIAVYFHKYRHNMHEIEPMKRFAHELGFDFEDTWAYYMPLEKLLQLMEGGLPEKEQRFVEEQFALPIVESVEAAKQIHDISRCYLLEDHLVVNVKGDVALCCTVYDMNGPSNLGHFVDMTVEDVKKAKSRHPTCDSCAKHNIFLHYTYYDVPELAKTYEHLAARNLASPASPCKSLSLPIVDAEVVA